VECGNGTQTEAGGNRKEKQRKLVIMENTIRVGRAKTMSYSWRFIWYAVKR